MRAGALVLMAIAAVALAAPRASANGGAYIEFEGAHHLPGEQVTGTVYVSIPAGKMDLLERGPFYAFVLPSGTAIDPGRGLPAGAIRVGTFTIQQEKDQTELKVTFTVPQTEGDYYSFNLQRPVHHQRVRRAGERCALRRCHGAGSGAPRRREHAALPAHRTEARASQGREERRRAARLGIGCPRRE
jgi:hypothetical protein